MAGEVLNSVDNILLLLRSDAVQEMGLAWFVNKELQRLQDNITILKNTVQDAEKQEVNSGGAKRWLQKIKFVVRDVDDLLDEFATEALRRQVETQRRSMVRAVHDFFTLPNHYEVGRKIKDIMVKLDQIRAARWRFDLGDMLVQIRVREKSGNFVTSSDVVGREGDKEAIIKLLASSTSEETIQILPIVAMGGLGKSTLAQLVCDDDWVKIQFKILWVCVSHNFDVKTVISKILRGATQMDYSGLQIEVLQRLLREVLRTGKYFLVLDDVWIEDPLQWIKLKVLLKAGAGRTRIVVTTRSRKVASVVGTMSPYELKGLSDEECLSIFVKHAIEERQESKHQHLMNIGREIVKKCGGVPLAAESLGKMLFPGTDEREWLALRDKEMWTLDPRVFDILPALKLSYNQLSGYLKRCFSYCSLFEKDAKLHKEDLIYHWMAQGLVESPLNQNKELEDVGEDYLDELVSISFLEHDVDKGCYKMHVLVHDLARYVAGNECCTIGHNTEIVPKGVSHVSFDSSFHCEFPSTLLEEKNLRTILLPRKHELSFCPSFEKPVSTFKSSRTLDINNRFGMPSSLRNMKHLRFLRLRWCHNMGTLTKSFGKLINLQFLDLRNSFICELPEDFGNLIKLRVLLLCSKLTCLPEKEMAGLTSLRIFRLLNNPELISLGEGIRYLTCLRQLIIFDCPKLTSWPSGGMGDLTCLRQLEICACPMLASLPSGMIHLVALEELRIIHCDALVFSEDDFQGLRKLRLLHLEELLGLVNLPNLQDAAASLEDIKISGCWNLKAMSSPNLTSLQTLEIAYCPELSALSEMMQCLTALHHLKIDSCPELSALPEGMQCLRHLKIDCCPILSQRCKEGSGEDWPKIAHVIEIEIDGTKKNSPNLGSTSHSTPSL